MKQAKDAFGGDAERGDRDPAERDAPPSIVLLDASEDFQVKSNDYSDNLRIRRLRRGKQVLM